MVNDEDDDLYKTTDGQDDFGGDSHRYYTDSDEEGGGGSGGRRNKSSRKGGKTKSSGISAAAEPTDPPVKDSHKLRSLFDRARNMQLKGSSSSSSSATRGKRPDAPIKKRQSDEAEEAFMDDLFSSLDGDDGPSRTTIDRISSINKAGSLSVKRRKLVNNPYVSSSPGSTPAYSKLSAKTSKRAGATPAHLVDLETSLPLLSSIPSGIVQQPKQAESITTTATIPKEPGFLTDIKSEQIHTAADVDDDSDLMNVIEPIDIDPQDLNTTEESQKSKLFKNEAADATDWLSYAKSMSSNTEWGATTDNKGLASEATTTNSNNPNADSSSLLMYWIDAFERNGCVYFIGKTYVESQKKFQSCCLVIRNIQRNLFVLPRQSRLSDPNKPISMEEAEQEFRSKVRTQGLTKFNTKKVSRKYAFEIPEIPRESEYLKVTYPFQGTSQLPHDLSGDTFSHLFGTTYSAMELLLLKRRIMGPSWLKINNVVSSNPPISWCRQEYVVDNPKSIRTLSDAEIDKQAPCAVPPLCIMACSVKTVLNHKENSNEVVATSLLFHNDFKLDDPTPIQQRKAEQYTTIRQLTGIPLPPGFSTMIQQHKGPRSRSINQNADS